MRTAIAKRIERVFDHEFIADLVERFVVEGEEIMQHAYLTGYQGKHVLSVIESDPVADEITHKIYIYPESSEVYDAMDHSYNQHIANSVNGASNMLII